MRVRFAPMAATAFLDTLTITCETTTLKVTLTGEGLRPAISLQPSDISFPDCLVGQSVEEKVRVINSSAFPVTCTLTLARQYLAGQGDRDDSTDVVMLRHVEGRGVPNLGMLPPFSLAQSLISVAAGQSVEVPLLFQPDRASTHFLDMLSLSLGSDPQPMASTRIKARAFLSPLLLAGCDDVMATPEEGLLSALLASNTEETYTLLFRVPSKADKTKISRELALSLLRAGAGEKDKGKKGGCEFTVDLQQDAPLFAVDASKGTVDSSAKKLLFSLTPPDITPATLAGGLPRPLAACRATITVKVDNVVLRARVLLRAIVVA